TGPLPVRSASFTCLPPGAASVKSGALSPTARAAAGPATASTAEAARRVPIRIRRGERMQASLVGRCRRADALRYHGPRTAGVTTSGNRAPLGLVPGLAGNPVRASRSNEPGETL